MSKMPHREYLKRVAKVLERTGHPRRNEVLDDLRTHLEELSAQSGEISDIEKLIETIGSPEEYAESLAPATGFLPKPWFRRTRVWVSGLAVLSGLMLVLVGALSVFPDRYTIRAYFRDTRGENFVAPSPFFDLQKALALKPGVGGQEIRDAIGYPWQRYAGMSEVAKSSGILFGDKKFANTANRDEVVWEYTKSIDANAPFYTACNVITDVNERLLRVETFRIDVPIDSREFLPGTPGSYKAGGASFTRLGANELRLSSNDPNVYVMVSVVVRNDEDIQVRLKEVRERVTASWRNVPMDKVRFIFRGGAFALTQSELAVNRALFEKKLKALPPDAPVYDAFACGSYVRGDVDAVQFYKRGTVYECPPVFESRDDRIAQSERRDQNWLIHRLVSENN